MKSFIKNRGVAKTENVVFPILRCFFLRKRKTESDSKSLLFERDKRTRSRRSRDGRIPPSRLRRARRRHEAHYEIIRRKKGKSKVIRGHYYSRGISAPGPDEVGMEEFHQAACGGHEEDTRPTMKLLEERKENQK
jgi:hypothetical protein